MLPQDLKRAEERRKARPARPGEGEGEKILPDFGHDALCPFLVGLDAPKSSPLPCQNQITKNACTKIRIDRGFVELNSRRLKTAARADSTSQAKSAPNKESPNKQATKYGMVAAANDHTSYITKKHRHSGYLMINLFICLHNKALANKREKKAAAAERL